MKKLTEYTKSILPPKLNLFGGDLHKAITTHGVRVGFKDCRSTNHSCAVCIGSNFNELDPDIFLIEDLEEVRDFLDAVIKFKKG